MSLHNLWNCLNEFSDVISAVKRINIYNNNLGRQLKDLSAQFILSESSEGAEGVGMTSRPNPFKSLEAIIIRVNHKNHKDSWYHQKCFYIISFDTIKKIPPRSLSCSEASEGAEGVGMTINDHYPRKS
jgi:hypothetical protein